MHCLSIVNSCLPIRDRMMEFIVHQIIDIDAEISIPDHEEDHDDLQFDLDDSKSKPSTRAQDMAEKLDNIMNRVFDFINNQYEVKNNIIIYHKTETNFF